MVVDAAVARWLLWPLMGIWEFIARAADDTDPRAHARRIAEQNDRIRELERELGMK